MNPDLIITTTIGPLVTLIIQAIKPFLPNLGKRAIALNVFLSTGFSTLLVDWDGPWQTIALDGAGYTLAIAGIAAGVYSIMPPKKEEDVEQLG